MKTIELNTRVQRNPRLVWADVDDETVLMSIEQGSYFCLGGVGTRIWELLGEPATVEKICQDITSEFDVDPPTCVSEVLDFLAELSEVDLVRVC